MDVSVIIVNYNTCELTLQCLRSIYENTNSLNFEIIVVDNNSEDDSVVRICKKYPQVRLIKSDVNLGFGKANNKGASIAHGKYLLFLNSDTIVISNIIKNFYDYMEIHQEYASCGGNLLDRQGGNTMSHGCFPSLLQEFSDIGFLHFYKKYYKNSLSIGQTVVEGEIYNVDYISGADIFIRKCVFDEMNGFDRNFFMYYEETDLFFRMHNFGFKSCLLPYCCLIHLEGESFKSKSKFNPKKYEISLKSKMYYFRKNLGAAYVCILKLFCILSILTHIHNYKSYTLRAIALIIKS